MKEGIPGWLLILGFLGTICAALIAGVSAIRSAKIAGDAEAKAAAAAAAGGARSAQIAADAGAYERAQGIYEAAIEQMGRDIAAAKADARAATARAANAERRLARIEAFIDGPDRAWHRAAVNEIDRLGGHIPPPPSLVSMD